jgi:hypothetical protein
MKETVRAPRNIIHFLYDRHRNTLYSNRVHHYFPPPLVHNVAADNLDAFLKIIKASTGEWDLLVTDSDRAKFDAYRISEFMRKNPKCRVAVLRVGSDASSPLPSADFQANHESIEDWLQMMSSLLS